MAYNLLVDLSERKNDWIGVHTSIKEFLIEGVDIFPIPDFFDSGKNYLGISLLSRNLPSAKQLRNLIEYFFNEGDKMFDLYDGNEVTVDNLEMLLDKIFGP